ncbi:hypothetical protein CY34DRAFT_15585 [Suillus luteus UH-Slu-Lm8-n1]|uniref:Uncharacterized protein n=1 Tax=Suillus luteus UH-Slu-Lm8-n1 TaxID=930992 RepID=A0A0D0AHM5_9AGAM|nr:hypothetical protein CY34DRAFT_15585 [Suillus luteus UH-Slu-Lm8-n1]
MAQLIAEVSSNVATIVATILHSPPAPTHPAPDHGPNVDNIIATAEQLDLEQAAHHAEIEQGDIFASEGRLSIELMSP